MGGMESMWVCGFLITGWGYSESVQKALIDAGLEPATAEITMRSSLSTELDESGASSMIKLLEMLEDLDDVQSVFSNADIPDEILAGL